MRQNSRIFQNRTSGSGANRLQPALRREEARQDPRVATARPLSASLRRTTSWTRGSFAPCFQTKCGRVLSQPSRGELPDACALAAFAHASPQAHTTSRRLPAAAVAGSPILKGAVREREPDRMMPKGARPRVHWVHMRCYCLYPSAHDMLRRRRAGGGAWAACYGDALRRRVRARLLRVVTYRWRARHILAKDQPEWGDPQGPLLVTFVVIFMLLSAWVAEMKVWLSSS